MKAIRAAIFALVTIVLTGEVRARDCSTLHLLETTQSVSNRVLVLPFWQNLGRPFAVFERPAGRPIRNSEDLVRAIRNNRSLGIENVFVIIKRPGQRIELRLAQEQYHGHVAISGNRPVFAAGRVSWNDNGFIFDNFTGNFRTSAEQITAIGEWFRIFGSGEPWQHEVAFPGVPSSGTERFEP